VPAGGFLASQPATLWFLGCLALFTLGVTVLAEGFGSGTLSTSMVKILGMTLCLCLIAVAMDVVWGYCGILSLGHFAFFGIGGYAIGMWLMYARTEGIVTEALLSAPIPPTETEITDAIAGQIFGVVGSSELPALWGFAHSLPLQLAMVVLVPGLLALVFGWLAFRSRVTGVYLSILTQAMTLALSLYLFQNDSGLRGNNGLSGLQNIPGLDHVPQATLSLWFFWASAAALGLGYLFFAWLVSDKLARSSARSATTRRGCGSSATRWSITSWWSLPSRPWSRGSPGRSIIRRRASSTRRKSPPSPRSIWLSGWRSAGAGGFMAR